ncbi:hypothetical protein ACFQ9Z_07480 [Streptomyces sp. NPDC056580]
MTAAAGPCAAATATHAELIATDAHYRDLVESQQGSPLGGGATPAALTP